MIRSKKPIYYILEENPVYCEIIPLCLGITFPNSRISTFSSPAQMIIELSQKPDLLVSEYSFAKTDFNGDRLLTIIKEKSPKTKVIFFTSHHNIYDAVKSIKSGASDYIPKSKTALDDLIKKMALMRRNMEYVEKSNRALFYVTTLLFTLAMALATMVILYQKG